MKTGQEHDGTPEAVPVPKAPAKPNDELWGRMVIIILGLGLVSMLGFFALIGYQIYDERSEESPSIAEMPKNVEPSVEVAKEAAPATETKPAAEASAADAKQAVVSVLNSGGAKGSAGVLADLLKQAGYAKVTAGNATGDYAVTAVFYGEGQESVAKTILAEVVKKYPKATVVSADPKKADTTASAVVVIIGSDAR